jgi:hypothetical protein
MIITIIITITIIVVVIIIIIFRMHLASSKWSPKRRVAYIHVGEPSERGSL